MRAIVLSSFLLACAISSPIVAMDQGDKKPTSEDFSIDDFEKILDDYDMVMNPQGRAFCFDGDKDIPTTAPIPSVADEKTGEVLPVIEGIYPKRFSFKQYVLQQDILNNWPAFADSINLDANAKKIIDGIADKQVSDYVKSKLFEVNQDNFDRESALPFVFYEIGQFDAAKEIFLSLKEKTSKGRAQYDRYSKAISSLARSRLFFKKTYNKLFQCLSGINSIIEAGLDNLDSLTPKGRGYVKSKVAGNLAVRNFLMAKLANADTIMPSYFYMIVNEKNHKLLKEILTNLIVKENKYVPNNYIGFLKQTQNRLEAAKTEYSKAKDNYKPIMPFVASRPPADQQSSSDEEKKPAAKKQKKPAQDDRKQAAK